MLCGHTNSIMLLPFCPYVYPSVIQYGLNPQNAIEVGFYNPAGLCRHIFLVTIRSVSAYSYAFLHSMWGLKVMSLTHSCTLLNPFAGFRSYLAGTLVGSNDTLSLMGAWVGGVSRENGIFGVEPPAKTSSCRLPPNR